MQPKRCVWCNKLFVPKSGRQNSCGDTHYRPCAICGKPLQVKESYVNYMKYGPRTCPECRKTAISNSWKNRTDAQAQLTNHKRIQTCRERYGVDNPVQNPEIRAKINHTVKERYGVDNLSQSPIIQDKIRTNSVKRYGVDHYSKDPDIRNRMKQGMVKAYGVEYATQSAEIMDKLTDTNIKKYGVPCVLASADIQQKIQNTCMSRYGVRYAAQAPEVIEKRKATNKVKYGASGYVFSDDYLNTLIQDPSKAECASSFRADPKKFITDLNLDHPPTYQELAKLTGLSDTTISYHVVKHKLQRLIQYNKSTMEAAVSDWILQRYPDCELRRNVYSIVQGKELDIYLPEYHIGIECNPTVTHNSSLPDPWGGEPKHYKYHQDKSLKAKDAGVFLFHIFGYEWTHKRDIILSMLSNLLGGTSSKIYARNTEVVQLSDKECKEFLNANHRQGGLTAKIRLGLKEKRTGELVSVMTFNKMRSTIGEIKNTESRSTYELSRFCSKLYTSVIGGASKLFKYFCNNYDVEKIVSFSDLAHTRGELYQILGFKSVSLSAPGYVWVNGVDDSSLHRVNCQKSNLPKLFHDDTIDIKNKTEKEIMEEHGYVRVYDSGVIRWEWKSDLV